METKFSYFPAPVSNTKPIKEVDLFELFERLTGGSLKEATEKIRAGKADKTEILPSVTPAGVFKTRCKTGLKEYSGEICIDIDHVNPLIFKSRIATDCFLNPSLLFISPSGFGMKIFVHVDGGIPEDHQNYYNAISTYLKGTYGIEADPSCKDISRLCFLCQDPDAYFNPSGSVPSRSLLKLLPPEPLGVLSPISDTGVPRFENQTYSIGERPSDLLNRMEVVHQRAVADLRAEGWTQRSGTLWRKPFKHTGNSAIYNFNEAAGIWIMTNFSTKAPTFKTKGYSDVQIICELEYGGNFMACIRDLASEYL